MMKLMWVSLKSSHHDSSSSSEKEPEDNDPDGSELDHATAGPPPKRQRNS